MRITSKLDLAGVLATPRQKIEQVLDDETLTKKQVKRYVLMYADEIKEQAASYEQRRAEQEEQKLKERMLNVIGIDVDLYEIMEK